MWMLLHLLNRKVAVDDPLHNCKKNHLIHAMYSNDSYTSEVIKLALKEGFVEDISERLKSKQRVYSITKRGIEYKVKLEDVLKPFYKGQIMRFAERTQYGRDYNLHPK